MTLQEQLENLIASSAVLINEQKDEWISFLPKLNDDEQKKLKQILLEEVEAWKKSGIEVLNKADQEIIMTPVKEPQIATVAAGPMPPSPPSIPKPPLPPKEMTNFEKKLASASQLTKETAHGEDLESLKHRLEATKNKEASKPTPKIDMNEINREVKTKELPAHLEAKAVPKPIHPKPAVAPKPLPKPAPVQRPAMPVKPVEIKPFTPFDPKLAGLGQLSDINSFEDLKKIEVRHLRQGSLAAQVESIKSKVYNLAHHKKVMPFYAVAEFEQSPLFRAYLNSGTATMTGKQGELNQEEFEAVADLKKHIEQL